MFLSAQNTSRQQPSSCSTCRKKKLKCDRQRPCSNCSVRGLACEFPLNHGRAPPLQSNSSRVSTTHHAADQLEQRLLRLEAAVFGTTRNTIIQSFNADSSTPEAVTADYSSSSEKYIQDDEFASDSTWLLSADSRHDSRGAALPSHTSHAPTVEMRNLSDIDAAAAGDAPQKALSTVLLPFRKACLDLFDVYVASLHSMQSILYPPTILELMNNLYDTIETRTISASTGHAGLVFALLASVAAFWSWGGPRHEDYTSLKPRTLSLYWLESAMQILDIELRSSVRPSLETIQASVLVVFMLYRLDSSSAGVQHYHKAAMTAAEGMGLNVIDLSSSTATKPTTASQIIDLEIKRRIWWHLCATDWFFPFIFDNAPCITSTAGPQRMRVHKPRNINDVDLLNQGADFQRPAHEETSMTYYLHRIRLGELCKEIVDLKWSTSSLQLVQVSYDRILDIDKKFLALADEFLLYSPSSASLLDRPLSQQQSVARLTALTLRAKLHLPFMLRASRSRIYSYSRDVALGCARDMLKMSTMLPTMASTTMSKSLTLTGTLHNFFFACIVLVMDVCANPDTKPREERIAEVHAACDVLQTSGTRSEPVESFSASLATIMQKYGLQRIVQHEASDSQLATGPYDELMSEDCDLLGLQGSLYEVLGLDTTSNSMQW